MSVKSIEPKEIELECEDTTSSDDGIFETDDVVKYDKSPNSIVKFFRILFFRTSMPQLLKGRKGNLRVSDLCPIPKTLILEDYETDLKEQWEKEALSKHPSLFLAIFKKEWYHFLFAYILVTIYELFSLAFPLESQYIVKWLNKEDPPAYMAAVFICLAIVFQLIVCFSQEFGKKWIFVSGLRIRNGLIGLIYDKALKLNASGIEEPGRLVNLMANDAAVFVGNIEYSVFGLASPVMFIVLFVLIYIYMGKWVYVPLIVFVVFNIINFGFGFLSGFLYNKFVYMKDKRVSFMGEILHNIKFIKYNNWEKPMKKRIWWLRIVEEIWLVLVGFVRSSFYTITIEIGAILSLSMFVTMVLSEAELQLANVITTISLFNSIRIPIRTVGMAATCISSINVSLGRIKRFLLKPELQPIQVVNKESENAIEMTDVNYIFPDGETAFACDELKIKKGELVCVLGSVGSGKSSFLLSLLNELEKKKGESYLNGKITYSSQSAWLMNTTVRENICFLAPYNKEKYKQAIKDACLTSDIDNLVGGDQYVVAEKGSNLSGGQRQRIALARSLYNAHDIMLLDDPLSAVDFHVGTYIFENAIKKSLEGKTRVIVTNQTYFIEKADRILVIDGNKLAFNGSLEELKNSNLEASQFIKTLSSKKSENNEENGEVLSGDSYNTKTREEGKELGRVSFKVYWEYIKAGLVFLGAACIVFLAARIVALYFYNKFLTTWGRSIRPKLGLPQGNREEFNKFCYTFIADFVGVYLTEIFIIFFCITSSHNIHKKMVKKVMNAKLGFFDVTPMGRVLNYFSRDFQNIDYTLATYIEPLIVNISTIVIVAITITKASIYLVILVLVIAAVFVAFYIFTSKPVIEMQRLEGVSRSPIFVHFDQTLLGLSTIRISNGQSEFKNKLIDKIKNNTMAFYTCKMAKLWYLQRMDWIGAFIIVVTTTVICITKINNGMDPSTAGTALTNLTNIPSTITVLGMAILEIETLMQSTERILQLNKLRNEESESVKENYEQPPNEWPSKGEIKFEDYKFRYRRGLPLVLNGINALIEDKEKIGVVGRTGSGKSTLMAGLFRIEEPAGGRILVDGIDITRVPLHTLRNRMCILPQEATMFSGTVRENLDPTKQASDEEMKRVLKLVNSVNELDDVVLENGDNFSLGQRQIICLARALLKKSKILIMDEATANIDIQTDKTIQEMVRKNFNECTVITVAHRLQSIMDANKVFVFDKGKLVENDSPSHLIDNENTIFNHLVQQSGCADELKRVAKKKTTIFGSNSTKNTFNDPNKSSDSSDELKPELELNLLNNSNNATPVHFEETNDRNGSERHLLSPVVVASNENDLSSPSESSSSQ
ncbi:multidrug resistance-associated protein, putative [Entamoeba dispar SAW760]|uniref:Multidrug resistance-associated protein, putative n=1 Tax=Entamoeba dispar (strain ATCC PRA-260 / SAW760) TaxID=370354 RepID=B0EHR1_ENTDS|nr:multidrug resistance-associated protein, putative [Entamoeba dispar SAW760]EDR25855.1 multidrug resistance-associated protein, putative [Entamoeba dispar SAW760]|eukprot:EDR25855.1 multidrug resistance-associated protein, putative [Entamoeba dispar SAW760]